MPTQDQFLPAFKLASWNGATHFGEKLIISFSFFSDTPSYYSPAFTSLLDGINLDTPNSHALTGGQQEAFIQAFLEWSAVANIAVAKLDPNNTLATIAVTGGDFKKDETEQRFPYAFTQPLVENSGSNFPAGDIWINTTNAPGNTNSTQIQPGQNGFETFLHEIGHALGLSHPFNEDPSKGAIGETLFPSGFRDNQLLTTMSYNVMDGLTGNGHDPHKITLDGTPNGSQWHPAKPMLYDILAIQTLYGVNPNTATGDNSYQFKTGFDAVQAIWDASGNDTIDATGRTDAVTIDLRPGHFSFVGDDEYTSQQLISIAYQVAGQESNWIENAIGGSEADTLIGNDGNNNLIGGSGMDTYVYTYTIDAGGKSKGGFDAFADICNKVSPYK